MGKIRYKIQVDIKKYLSQAEKYVNSYFPNHWRLMKDLEKEAKEILEDDYFNIEKFAEFLAKIAFLKQPYRISISEVKEVILKYRKEAEEGWKALKNLDLDYQIMDTISKIPFFGRKGGRSFTSALLRIVFPEKFGIIDWRNLAVMANVKGFEGCISPSVDFSQVGLLREEILEKKGGIFYSEKLYCYYNDIIRELAFEYQIKPAEVDLVLWSFSIEKDPFGMEFLGRCGGEKVFFEEIFSPLYFKWKRGELRREVFREEAKRKIKDYLEVLKSIGFLSPERVEKELKAIFKFIKREVEEFSKDKSLAIKSHAIHIMEALNKAILSSKRSRLISQWKRWEDWVNPASPTYRGISLPGSMISDGFVVFEDLREIREYFQKYYSDEDLKVLENEE